MGDGVVDRFSPGREGVLSSIKFFGIMRFDRVGAELSTSVVRLFEDDEGELSSSLSIQRQDEGRAGDLPTGRPVPASRREIA
jgi:hypothetical protein